MTKQNRISSTHLHISVTLLSICIYLCDLTSTLHVWAYKQSSFSTITAYSNKKSIKIWYYKLYILAKIVWGFFLCFFCHTFHIWCVSAKFYLLANSCVIRIQTMFPENCLMNCPNTQPKKKPRIWVLKIYLTRGQCSAKQYFFNHLSHGPW